MTGMTMTCTDAVRFIARFADAADSLDAVTRAEIAAHLEQCASCRSALETQRVVAAWLRTRPADHVSPDFAARLAARLDEVSGWFGLADWRVWTLRLAPLAAMLALAIVLGSETATPASVTLEDWTVGDSSSTASLLWQENVTSESLIETMLTGETPAASDGGAGNVR
jgi:putative zinc finger protein